MFLYQTRTLVIQVLGIENPSIDHLVHGFQEQIEEYKAQIEGIRFYNYKEGKFLVTFKQVDNIMLGKTRELVHVVCSKGYTTPDGLTLKSEIPQQPADMITLFPVPFEMEDSHIRILEKKGWGKIDRIQYGKLKHYPNIKNGYVNIFIKEPAYMRIENQVNLMGHWLSVTTPYNRHLPMCRFCKVRGHELEQCPKLEKRKEKEQKEEIFQPKQVEVLQPFTFGDFLIPKRKRSTSNSNQSMQKTSTPIKKKKQRKHKSKSKSNLNVTSSESSSSDDEERKIDDNNKRSINKINGKSAEEASSSSSEDVFETIKTQISIIKSLSDNNSKKGEDTFGSNNKSFTSYKDVVLKKL